MSKIRPEQPEWLKKRLYHRWQVVRRDQEYRDFCKGRIFRDGVLDEEESLEPEAERIMDLFGLELIYDPSYDSSHLMVSNLDF